MENEKQLSTPTSEHILTSSANILDEDLAKDIICRAVEKFGHEFVRRIAAEHWEDSKYETRAEANRSWNSGRVK